MVDRNVAKQTNHEDIIGGRKRGKERTQAKRLEVREAFL